MAILGGLMVIAALVAVLAVGALGGARKALAEAEKRWADTTRKLEALHSKHSATEAELHTTRQELREQRDVHKALKKKRWDDRKPSAATTAVAPPDDNHLELDRAWRKAEEARSEAVAQVTLLEARIATLEGELEGIAKRAAVAPAPSPVVPSPREAKDDEREAKDAKQIADLRRKLEWHRRIHLVQQKELELERDKTAHVRKRFLEVCGELVRVRKPDADTQQEIERLSREQAAYQAAEEAPAEAQA